MAVGLAEAVEMYTDRFKLISADPNTGAPMYLYKELDKERVVVVLVRLTGFKDTVATSTPLPAAVSSTLGIKPQATTTFSSL